jgi:hypothetical protein
MKNLEEVVTILESADENTSAEELKAKIKPIAERMSALQARMKDLPKPSKEEAQQFAKEYGMKAMALSGRLATAMAKFAKVPGLRDLLKDFR